jgi:hypothetical protein
MRAIRASLVAASLESWSASTAAQQPAAPTGEPVNVGQLPIDLARIQRRLKASTEQQARDGLNLRFFVDVYAPAPAIVLFTKEDDLLGPAPYGAPTTQQMLQALTPRGLTPPPTGRIQRRSKKK